jgi:hypothetical protein
MGSLPLVCVGILGEYVARVYDEVRQRPLSIINHVYRADTAFTSQLAPERAVHLKGDGDLGKLFPAA